MPPSAPAPRRAARRHRLGHACRDRRPCGRAAGGLHHPRGGLGRPHHARGATDGAQGRRGRLRPRLLAGAQQYAEGYRGRARMRGPRRPRDRGGCHLRRPRCGGTAPSPRRSPSREVPLDRLWHAVPRLPHHRRGVVAAAGGAPTVVAVGCSSRPPRSSARSTGLLHPGRLPRTTSRTASIPARWSARSRRRSDRQAGRR